MGRGQRVSTQSGRRRDGSGVSGHSPEVGQDEVSPGQAQLSNAVSPTLACPPWPWAQSNSCQGAMSLR